MSNQFGAQVEFAGTLSLSLIAGGALVGALTDRGREMFGRARAAVMAGIAAVAVAVMARGMAVGLELGGAEAAGFLVIAAATWRAEPRSSRPLLGVTAAAGLAAAAAHWLGAHTFGGWLDLLTTGLGVACLVRSSSRSLSAQITAVAGGVAGGAIVVLATLVSVGVQGDLRTATAQQLDTRLQFEANLAARVPADTLTTAGLSARGPALASQVAPLQAADRRQQADPAISTALARSRVGAAALLFVTPHGLVAGTAGVSPDLAAVAARLDRTLPAGHGELRSTADGIVAIAGVPVEVADRTVGDVVAVQRVAGQVSARSSDRVTLRILTADQAARVGGVAGRAMAARTSVTSTGGSTLVAAVPLGNSGQPPLGVLTASTPTRAIAPTQRSLLRWLLVIAVAAALGVAGACLALGRRIGRRITLLTVAAGGLRAGNLQARAGLSGDDEVGRLGATFDGMAASLEQATADLSGTLAEESALRERLASVVGGIQEAVVAVDPSGRVTEFNASAESLLGISAAEATGRAVSDVVRLRPTDVIDAVAATARPGAEPLRRAHAVLDDGDVPVELSAAPLDVPGGAVVLLRDLRPELEAERAKNEVIQRVSHELRTPLTPIKGWATLLGRRDLNAGEAAQIGGELLASAARLERTFEQLIFMARSASGAADVRMAAVSPADLVNETVRDWLAPTAHKVVVRCEKGLPAVEADRRWLTQAMRELLDNAAKFSPAGTDIVVAARRGPERGEVSVSVSDTGGGLPENVDRVLSAFEQGDGSITRSHEGLGLGLAIVDRVVRAHGGRLEIRSGSSGTTMTLVVPVIGERGVRRRRAGAAGPPVQPADPVSQSS